MRLVPIRLTTTSGALPPPARFCPLRRPARPARRGGERSGGAMGASFGLPRRDPQEEGVRSVQIKISARHGHLNEATQQFIRDKAQKLLHFFQRLTMIEVLVDLKEDQKVVEFKVSAEHKHDFVARESNHDLL